MNRREPCIEWAELLALRPEDLPPSDRASLEAHLAVCPACVAVNDHYRQIQISLEALPVPSMEPIPYSWKGQSRRDSEGNQRGESSIDILECYADYIYALVRQHMLRAHQPAELIDLEVDELAQRVRIKLWQVLEKRSIAYPRAYIRAIVNSEIIDMMRHRGLQLSPSFAQEEQRGLPDLMEKIVEKVLALPPRQQRAMICSLQEQLDDFSLLVEAFLCFGVDIRNMHWPEEESEKRLLRASLSVARKNLRLALSDLQERGCWWEDAEITYTDQMPPCSESNGK